VPLEKQEEHMNFNGDLRTKVLTSLGLLGLLAAPGCIGGVDPISAPGNPGLNPNPVGDDDDDDDVNPGVNTTLTGVVRGVDGMPIEGVTVTTNTGLQGQTDRDGRFVFDDVEPAEGVLVDFDAPGYAETQKPFDVYEGVENTMIQVMVEVDLVETFSATDGLNFTLSEGPSVELPADNFVDADGNAYTGNVTVEATWYDLTTVADVDDPNTPEIENINEIVAAPGDFTAIDFNGDDQRLESFGMLQVNLLGENGEELQLGGDTSEILLPVVDLGGLDVPVAGETVPAWHVDVDGELFARFDAPHFSTWNCDQPMPTHGCVSGVLTDAQGQPRAGATAKFIGQTYVSTTTARTAQDGSFCIEVKNGETGFVEFSYTIAAQTATQRTDPVTIPAGQGTCTDGDTSDCVDIGEIPMDIVTCVSGVVVNSQNQGLSGVTVVSPQGGQAVTDAQGAFCLTVPVFATTEVYVVTDQQGMQGFQPQAVYSQPGLPACQGGCPNLVFLRPYQSTGCASGQVLVNNQQQMTIPVEVFDTAFPEIAIYTGLTEADGSFCLDLPAGVEVEVSVGAEEFLCDSQIVTANNNGATCDSTSQQGECLPLQDIVCNF
jgi:hypothetical protein